MLLTGDFLSLLGIFNTKLSECRILSWDTQLILLVLILSNVPQREEPTGTGPLRPLNARRARGGLARLPRPARSPCCCRPQPDIDRCPTEARFGQSAACEGKAFKMAARSIAMRSQIHHPGFVITLSTS